MMPQHQRFNQRCGLHGVKLTQMQQFAMAEQAQPLRPTNRKDPYLAPGQKMYFGHIPNAQPAAADMDLQADNRGLVQNWPQKIVHGLAPVPLHPKVAWTG
jgi:hypothetical protein